MVNFQCKSKACWFSETYEDGLAPRRCPECGGQTYRLSFPKELKEKKPFVNVGYKDNPRWSWSMGVNKSDIPEMMRKYPNRTYHPKTGQLLVKNRPEKKRLMREHNLEEY